MQMRFCKIGDECEHQQRSRFNQEAMQCVDSMMLDVEKNMWDMGNPDWALYRLGSAYTQLNAGGRS